MKVRRLLSTIRYLRFRQMIGQARHYGLGILPRPRKMSAAPEFPGLRPGLSWPRACLPFPPSFPDPAALLRGEFSFLNRSRNIGWFPCWGQEGPERLWLYNLHYFQWLHALDFSAARAVVLDWIERCLPSGSGVGWEPYPVSVRLINWMAVFYGKFLRETIADAVFGKKLWESVFLQAQWLESRLETRLLGNHYMENACALVLCGSCFRGEAAETWYRRGRGILRREIPEQILPDGLHFELSPMYHQRATYLMILLAHTALPEVAWPAAAALERMLSALDKVSHPDGGIALFNDSALGIYPSPAWLREAAGRIPALRLPGSAPAGGWELPDAGYFGFRDGKACLICDAGPIGPDYIPGHGHGDIFSFELSLCSQRVVVDAGVFKYEPGPMRDYARSTRAHNTVEIEGRDQCEFWGAFRVGRRGRPRDVGREISSGSFSLWGWHDGYRLLPGAPIHHRRFLWSPPGVLEVEDRIESARPVRAVSRIHLHPACRIERREGLRIVASRPGGRFEIAFWGPGELALESSYYSPEFGLRLDNTALVFSWFGDKIKTGFRIAELE